MNRKLSWAEVLGSQLFSQDFFPLHLIVLQPLAQYWAQSVICDYHHSVALIGWLAFSRREGDAMMEKKFMAALDGWGQNLLTSGQKKICVDECEIGVFPTTSPCIIHKEGDISWYLWEILDLSLCLSWKCKTGQIELNWWTSQEIFIVRGPHVGQRKK